jgi:DNA-binding transcriptional regulator YiaG
MSEAYTQVQWFELAKGKTAAELAEMTGLTIKAVYERNRRTGVQLRTCGTPRMPVPEGFADAELGVPRGALAQRYGVSEDTIRRWSVQVAGLHGKTPRERWLERQRATFLEKYTTEHFYVAAQKLHIGTATVAKWAVEAGVASPKAIRMREMALRTSERKRQNRNAAPPSRASWFDGIEMAIERDLWAKAVRPWCPAWEMEEADA